MCYAYSFNVLDFSDGIYTEDTNSYVTSMETYQLEPEYSDDPTMDTEASDQK